ncbi:MAG: hypothetical protein EOM47_04220 [Bacteroidia bacterium]|jgi:hypothetical protein|nr:hypothetical protein [Paludibacter sp.]NCB68036.1 hypothetical protein [Bacteroidia bacterium]
MNSIFNTGRLWLLIKRYFVENAQRELTYWGIITLVFMFMHQVDSVKTFLFISGFIFAARQYKMFAFTPGGMHYLLIPATHTEKLVTSILISIPYYFVMVVLTYLIGSTVGVTLGNLLFELDLPYKYDFLYSTSVFNGLPANAHVFSDAGLLKTFVNFTFIQSLFLMGSLFFRRNAAVKTMFSTMIFGVVLLLVQLLLFRVLFGSFSMGSDQLMLSGGDVFDTDTFNLLSILQKAGTWLAVPFFWVVSYFRLTEKQV